MATAKKNARKAAPKKAASKRAAKRGTATRRKTQKHGSSEDTEITGQRRDLLVMINSEGKQEVLEINKDESDNILFYIANNRGYITRPIHNDPVMRVQPEHQNNPLVQREREFYDDRKANLKAIDDGPRAQKDSIGKPSAGVTTLENKLTQHVENVKRLRALINKSHAFVTRVLGSDEPGEVPAMPDFSGNKFNDFESLNVHNSEMLDRLEKFIAWCEQSF